MNEWLDRHTIYVTLHGSQAYGLNNEFSDVDVKGICIPPREVEYHLYHRFEQAKDDPQIETNLSYLKNPKNPKFESEIYSMRKFFLLAAEVNPNIIELLWTDPKHHFVCNPPMDQILEHRNLFLSNKAKFTFAGYACAQAKKIERHRKWIVLGEVQPPKREDYGLLPIQPKGIQEVMGFIKAKVEQWNLNQFPLEDVERNELKDTMWDLMSNITDREISVANWPDVYSEGVIHKMKGEFNLKDEVVSLIYAERAFSKAKQVYDSWVLWKKERNPARRALEEKSGYDTKHASHLVRLMRMGYEILTTGQVIVNRTGWTPTNFLPSRMVYGLLNRSWSLRKVWKPNSRLSMTVRRLLLPKESPYLFPEKWTRTSLILCITTYMSTTGKKKQKKIKLQVSSKGRGKGMPKWIPPEKRMKTYDDYGCGGYIPMDDPRWKKMKWCDFRIIVPDQETKEQLQAAFEYFHDNRDIDTDFIAVNAVAHSYLDDKLEEGAESPILVDPDLFKQVKQKTCKHNREHYFYDTMEFCRDCHACLAVTSYRG